MAGKITRRVFRLNTSKAITLPPEWSVEVGDEVLLLYDRYLLVVPSSEAEKVEKAIERAILETFSKTNALR